jgi:hypothetical protein
MGETTQILLLVAVIVEGIVAACGVIAAFLIGVKVAMRVGRLEGRDEPLLADPPHYDTDTEDETG